MIHVRVINFLLIIINRSLKSSSAPHFVVPFTRAPTICRRKLAVVMQMA